MLIKLSTDKTVSEASAALPAAVQAKEVELLKDQAEKATGQESVALNKMIRDKSQ